MLQNCTIVSSLVLVDNLIRNNKLCWFYFQAALHCNRNFLLRHTQTRLVCGDSGDSSIFEQTMSFDPFLYNVSWIRLLCTYLPLFVMTASFGLGGKLVINKTELKPFWLNNYWQMWIYNLVPFSDLLLKSVKIVQSNWSSNCVYMDMY